ncbi:MAG: hypothetical protein WAM78_21590 [Candidatus Sulfotelmatobacter sp.]
MTHRIRFITHHDKKILLIDVSNCSADGVESIFRAVPDFVTTQPRGSVLILSDFTGASFNPDAIRVMKETAVFDKVYVNKSAWAGKSKDPQVISEDVSGELGHFARREFPVFETREEALAWLTKD